MKIDKETTDWWKESAKDAGGQVGSGQTDPDKILTLITALEAVALQVTRHGECICNTGPGTDGPEEWCGQHGRPYHDAIAYLSSILEAQRFALARVLDRADKIELYNEATAKAIREAVKVRAEDYTYPLPAPEVAGVTDGFC